MKTTSYNPGTSEVQVSNALHDLKGQINDHLGGNQIVNDWQQQTKDNPTVKFSVVDADGDPHEIVVRTIQIPDKF